MSKNKQPIHAKLIANPGAGQIVKQPSLMVDVTRNLMQHNIKVDVALAHPIDEATKAAKRAVKDGYDIIIAMGGDGTLGAVIRGMVGAKARLGIIPAGTANDFALSLGIPKGIEESCALIAAGSACKLDLGRLRTRKTDRFDFFMVTTVGIVSTVFPMVKNVPEGEYAHIMDAFKTLFKFNSTPTVFLSLDGQPEIKVETMLVTITNTPLIGLHNLVAPDASLRDGLLDVSVYPGFSKSELLAYFAKTVDEKGPADERVQRFRASKIKIRTSPKLDIAAEGLLMGKGKAWIKALPGAIRVIVPEGGPTDGRELAAHKNQS